MSRILLFTSKSCPLCLKVKKTLAHREYEEFDVDTVSGKAEASYYDVLSVPTIIFTGDNEEARFIGILPDGWEQYV